MLETVPVECEGSQSSVAAVDQSPGSNMTGSAVPVECRPTEEIVDVAEAADGGEAGSDQPRDDDEDDNVADVVTRLNQVSTEAWTGSGSVSGTQTLPARLHSQQAADISGPRRRSLLRNVFCGDSDNTMV